MTGWEETLDRIASAVSASPGRTAAELSKALGMDDGGCTQLLLDLSRQNRVRLEQDGLTTRYYPDSPEAYRARVAARDAETTALEDIGRRWSWRMVADTETKNAAILEEKIRGRGVTTPEEAARLTNLSPEAVINAANRYSAFELVAPRPNAGLYQHNIVWRKPLDFPKQPTYEEYRKAMDILDRQRLVEAR